MEDIKRSKLAYLAMTFYIILYYIFIIFSNKDSQYFDIIKMGFEGVVHPRS